MLLLEAWHLIGRGQPDHALPPGQHPSPIRTGIYDLPIFRSWDNSSPNTVTVRNLHRRTDPNTAELERT